jgi:uncharacterized protein YkwD
MRHTHVLGLSVLAVLLTAIVSAFGQPEAPAYSGDDTRSPTAIATTTTEPPASAPSEVTVPAIEMKSDVAAETLVAAVSTTTVPVAEPAPETTEPASPPPTSKPAPASTTTTADPPAVEAGPSPEFESQFAKKINGFRSDQGLSALSRDGSLDARARSWAEKMAGDGGLSHSNLGSLLPPWSAAGENVGMGGSVKAVFSALAGSSGHRSNMLGDYTHFGVGVWVDSSGVIWTAHVFTR